MKLIRVSTELEVSIEEIPEPVREKTVLALIGSQCELYERVLPRRLYTVLGHYPTRTRMPGKGVIMLVDEEGCYRESLKVNAIGSYLYESDRHGNGIFGNILFVSEKITDEGWIDLYNLDAKVLENLYGQLQTLADRLKSREPVYKK